MVLGKLPVPGRPTILITVEQGPIALTNRYKTSVRSKHYPLCCETGDIYINSLQLKNLQNL